MEVLHVFGSTQDDFYFELSKMYASAVVRPAGVRHRFAGVSPSGDWRFGPDPDDLGPAMTFDAALAQVGSPDLMVPHMFCRKGMTTYRALFEDLLGIPVVGASAAVAGLATSKLWTRDVVSAAGVKVADGERLAPGNLPALPVPYVVKPDSEDNSLGISVVRDPGDAAEAVAHARRFADVVFVESYIPGRELRVAVVERNGDLYVPAMTEYPVSEARPIREVEDKLQTNRDGSLRQSVRSDAQPICPAQVSDDTAEKLVEAAMTAHCALGARHYSLFDFRVHADSAEPYMLEAGLFWSFSDLSAISKMLVASGEDPVDVAHAVWTTAAGASVKPVDQAA
ncbi:MAG: D-alanine--D-alanine ligase [Pseudomonadota bacterium]